MTISANTLGLLMDAGIEGDELMAIVRSIEADIAPKAKSSGAARQARYREAQKAKTVTSDVTGDVTETSQVTPLAGVDAKTKNTQIEPVKKTPSRDVADFRQVLSVLSDEQLDGLIKIRRTKRAPLTGYAAKLFIKAAGTCDMSVMDAADTCIERNWLTVKLDWLSKPAARGSPPPRQPNLADALAAATHFAENRYDPRSDPSDESPRRTISDLSRVSG